MYVLNLQLKIQISVSKKIQNYYQRPYKTNRAQKPAFVCP